MEKRPKWRGVGPIWWHLRGAKMRLAKPKEEADLIVIEGSAAKVIISEGPHEDWCVSWEVIHSVPNNIKATSQTLMTDDQLAAAFGLTDQEVDEWSEWLIEQFGGSVASQGSFIRYRDFLNIPCPGTGHDGDPNISIALDDEICGAVRRLLVEKRPGFIPP